MVDGGFISHSISMKNGSVNTVDNDESISICTGGGQYKAEYKWAKIIIS